MEDLTYSNLANKGRKVSRGLATPIEIHELTLKDFKDQDISDPIKLSTALCNDLKRLLELEGIKAMAEGLLAIQAELEHLQQNKLHSSKDLIGPDHLYKNLAQLILRSLAQTTTRENLDHELQEAIRVAIEEETYRWPTLQNKMTSKTN